MTSTYKPRFQLSASKTPVRVNLHGAALCRYCNEVVPKNRMTFCSSLCVHEWKMRTDKNYVRQQVFKRDKGVCYDCGKDCVAEREKLIVKPGDVFLIPSQWEAHHNLAVCEGGAQCGLDNYLTLCIDCHRSQTERLTQKRKMERHRSQMLIILECLESRQAWFDGLSTKELVSTTGFSKSAVRLRLVTMYQFDYVQKSWMKNKWETTVKGQRVIEKLSANVVKP